VLVVVAVKLRENARLVEEVVAGRHGHRGRDVFSRLCIALVDAFLADSTRLEARCFRNNIAVGVVDVVSDVVGHF
jgi:hypothetical protein